MENKKLGTVLLSGLMVGPILGSGVILLPPLGHAQIGPSAIWAWLITMILGGFFATIFARMALAFPGSQGVSLAVRQAFGPAAGRLAANFIISAVCIGPMAVLITAAQEITRACGMTDQMIPAVTFGLLVCCQLLLLKNITAVSRINLIFSSLVAVVLVLGSLFTIVGHPPAPLPPLEAPPMAFGQTLLLLFWSIVGWEILGNYSTAVKTPSKTIPRATMISVTAISAIYLLTAWAVYSSGGGSLTDVITPLLGAWAPETLAVITTLLCLATYLMIVGGIARLVNDLAKEGRFPVILAGQNRNEAPAAAIMLFGTIHTLVIVSIYFDLLPLETVIAFANVFFLANGLLCIIAGMRLLKDGLLTLFGSILCAGFLSLLIFSPPLILGVMFVVTAATLWPSKQQPFTQIKASRSRQ